VEILQQGPVSPRFNDDTTTFLLDVIKERGVLKGTPGQICFRLEELVALEEELEERGLHHTS